MTLLSRASMTTWLLATLLLASCQPAAEPAPPTPDLEVTHWAKEPMLQNPVGISHDPQGRLYATEANRRRTADLDVRGMRGLEPLPWPVLDYTIQSVENRRDILQTYLAPNSPYNNPWMQDFDDNGSADWRDLLAITERVNRIADTDNDGIADEAVVFAEDFNTEVTGTAGDVLWHDGQVYLTVIPDLWRLEDTDHDGVADLRDVLLTGHGVHIGQGGHDLHGLTPGPDGRIYWSIGDKGINLVSQEGQRFFYPNQGLVMRSEPDGSNFEVFAYGLRNCMELAFDDFGNLFCVDNDGDFQGERERLLYVTEGSDTGWRINWQFGHTEAWAGSQLMPSYHPWMDEGLSVPHFDGQAAYITPPLANYSDGPAGFIRNPGTALSEHYRDYYFLTQFPGQLITAFQIKPKGASFEMVNEHVFHQGFMATGLSFGPEGALYVADWAGDWTPTNEGGIFRIDVPAAEAHPNRSYTQELIENGMEGRTVPEMVELLTYPDQRVRLEAQFALVKRQAEADLTHIAYQQDAPLIARVHAIWGLGQMTRSNAFVLSRPIQDLLNDPEPEIRVQASKLITEAPHLYPSIAPTLVGLLTNTSPRVRFHALMALSDVGSAVDIPEILYALDDPAHQDPFLRHAGVSALTGIGQIDPLRALSSHPSRPVRLAAVVALRRLQSPEVAAFLDDADELVVLEAARAIHDDLSIPEALPALAALINTRSFAHEGLNRRILNANLRIGRLDDARALIAFAARPLANHGLRAEALDILYTWPSPPVLDRVERRARIFTERSEEDIAGLIASEQDRLFAITEAPVLNAALRLSDRYEVRPPSNRLLAWLADSAMALPIRHKALDLLMADGAQFDQALEEAFASNASSLRNQALYVLAGHDPEAALINMQTAFADTAALTERQNVFDVIATMSDSASLGYLYEWTSKLLTNNDLDSLELNIFEAAVTRGVSGLDAIAAAAGAGGTTPYRFSRYGGDVARGEDIFLNHPQAMCIRCHAVEAGEGSNVGPNLAGIGQQFDADYLLESLVDPSKTIAVGFQTVSLTLTNGEMVSGTLVHETGLEVTVRPLMGAPKTIAATDISERATSTSSIMPPMGAILTARELRDVVAYLASLE